MYSEQLILEDDYIDSLIERGVAPYCMSTDVQSLHVIVTGVDDVFINTSLKDIRTIQVYSNMAKVLLNPDNEPYVFCSMLDKCNNSVEAFIRGNTCSNEWAYDYVARLILGIKAAYRGSFDGFVMQMACLVANNRLVKQGSFPFVITGEDMHDFTTACKRHDRDILSALIEVSVTREKDFYNKRRK